MFVKDSKTKTFMITFNCRLGLGAIGSYSWIFGWAGTLEVSISLEAVPQDLEKVLKIIQGTYRKSLRYTEVEERFAQRKQNEVEDVWVNSEALFRLGAELQKVRPTHVE